MSGYTDSGGFCSLSRLFDLFCVAVFLVFVRSCIYFDYFCWSPVLVFAVVFFFFKQKTAYEMRISDWSSDVCSSDLQSFGIDPRRTIVIYDEGASWTATWLFSELHYYGFPTAKLYVLDGGLAKWEASGGALTKEASPAPKESEARRVGKECVGTCRSRWSPDH